MPTKTKSNYVSKIRLWIFSCESFVKIYNMDDLKTRVLCVDMPQGVINYLTKEQLDVYDYKVEPSLDARNLDYSWGRLPIAMPFNIPRNLHEYSMIIQDLSLNSKIIPYDISKHKGKKVISDASDIYKCLCLSKPQNVFDPLPFACRLIGNGLNAKKGKMIKVFFQSAKYYVDYSCIKTDGYIKSVGRFSNYECVENFTKNVLTGNRVKLNDEYMLAYALFSGIEEQLSYSQTFKHPTFNQPGSYKEELDENFIPLLFNEQDEIISYVYYNKGNSSVTFMLPQIDDKKVLLERLFTECLYKHFSELFPLQTKNLWLENDNYVLPEIIQLNREKEEALKQYEDIVKQMDKSIVKIKKKHNFLYSMLTETGENLVNNVKIFLEWLDFRNVKSMDATVKEGEDFEEDLQVLLDNNELLIIEVKGLHGTSKDNECAQISKIETRRVHEGKYSKVHSLYIVNNERGKEPLKRLMPPFTAHQIKDAEYSYRAMAYTYQLFNLYFEIQNSVITKEEARKALLVPGIVNFHSNFKVLGKPYNYFNDMTVACVEIHETNISVGDSIYFEDVNKRFHSTKILCIQVEHKNFDSINEGKVGIELESKVVRNAVLYIKK